MADRPRNPEKPPLVKRRSFINGLMATIAAYRGGVIGFGIGRMLGSAGATTSPAEPVVSPQPENRSAPNSNEEFLDETKTNEKAASLEQIQMVQQLFRKYIKPDADPVFWNHVNGLVGRGSGDVLLEEGTEHTLSIIDQSSESTVYNMLINEERGSMVMGSSSIIKISSDGGEYIESYVYKDGDIGISPTVSRQKMSREDMKRVGNQIFIFSEDSQEENRWSDINVPKGSQQPILAAGIEAHTKINGRDVTYRIDDYNTFSVSVSPEMGK